jgi:MFS transporter, SP family, arabinose:H+ symporter
MLQQWMITVGILAAYLVALVILRVAPGSAGTVGWRLIRLGAVRALLGFALRTTMAESPRWLIRKGQYDKAQEALATFGVKVSNDAVDATARELERQEQGR